MLSIRTYIQAPSKIAHIQHHPTTTVLPHDLKRDGPWACRRHTAGSGGGVGQLGTVQRREQHQRLEWYSRGDRLRLGSGHMQHVGPRHRHVSTGLLLLHVQTLHVQAPVGWRHLCLCTAAQAVAKTTAQCFLPCPGAVGASACAPASRFGSMAAFQPQQQLGLLPALSLSCKATRPCSCWQSVRPKAASACCHLSDVLTAALNPGF